MKKIIQILLILFTLISCNKKEKQNIENLKIDQNVLKENNETKIAKKAQNQIYTKKESDTVTIENQIAVIFEPTDKSIEKRKREIDEEDFYIGADDYMWYLNESNKFFEKQKIKVLNVKNDKILKFVGENRNITLIKLENEKELWGIYLFDLKQKPKRINMTDTEMELKEYFGI